MGPGLPGCQDTDENGAVMERQSEADEIDPWECRDADGEVYPEHTEDVECRRCGAEMGDL